MGTSDIKDTDYTLNIMMTPLICGYIDNKKSSLFALEILYFLIWYSLRRAETIIVDIKILISFAYVLGIWFNCKASSEKERAYS